VPSVRTSPTLAVSGRGRRPLGIGFGAEASKRGAADQMSLEVEGVVDGGMGGEESLGGRLALEELHLPFASSDRQVGILDPIVLTEPSGSVDLIQAQLAKRGSIRSQAIGRDRFGRNRLVAQQPRQKLQRRGVVPPAFGRPNRAPRPRRRRLARDTSVCRRSGGADKLTELGPLCGPSAFKREAQI